MAVGGIPDPSFRAVIGDLEPAAPPAAAPPTAPPAVPEPGDVPRSALTTIAAIANRPVTGPMWSTVRTGTPNTAGSIPAVGSGTPQAFSASGAPVSREPAGPVGPSGPATVAWRELCSSTGARRVEVLVAGVPVLDLHPEAERVRIGLVVPSIGRSVDVSVQPGTAVRALVTASTEAGIGHHFVEETARDAVEVAVGHTSSWTPPRSLPLVSVFGGMSFPLLAAAYDLGASPVTDIPRWAEPVLGAPTIALATSAAFGRLATRPVRRALVEALRPGPDGRVDLTILALALIGRRVLQPDRIARVLVSEHVPHPESDLPDGQTLTNASRVVVEWGAPRCERVLIDSTRRSDGLRLLLTTTGYALQLGADGPRGRLPNRLGELHDTYRVLMRSAPDPVPTQSTADATTAVCPRGNIGARGVGYAAGASAAGPADDARRLPAFPHPVLRARNDARALGTPRVQPSTGIEYPPTVRSLDGTSVGELRFVLPHTAGDLARWGNVLSNCLGGFARHVVSGTCWIIGVQRKRRLAYAIEVTDRGEIRQFNGRANRMPAKEDRGPIIKALVDAGVVDPHNMNNRPWFDAVSERHDDTATRTDVRPHPTLDIRGTVDTDD